MLSLAIHHNVYLTRDQRYSLHAGTDVTVVGVSIPVWVTDNRTTSEPAKEIFCKYYLKNPKTETPIQIVNDGYEVVLPTREGSLPPLTDEEWRHLNLNDPEKLDAYYKKGVLPACSKNLLDIKDGGSMYLSFREHNKMKRNGEFLNVIHFVNLADIEDLKNTLC